VTERVHPEFAEIAVRACRTLPGAIHCGVDLLAEDIETSAAGQRWAICEVNTCPDIALHHFPTHGTARDVAGDLIEHLFPDAKPLDRQGWRTVRATLKGRFNAAKSRPEVERMAMLRGLTGWIEPRRAANWRWCYAAPRRLSKTSWSVFGLPGLGALWTTCRARRGEACPPTGSSQSLKQPDRGDRCYPPLGAQFARSSACHASKKVLR
jgi:hypothetical protein